MKKAFSMFFAVAVMLCALSVPAFADNGRMNTNTNSNTFGTNSYGNYNSIDGTTTNRTNLYNATTNGVNRAGNYVTNSTNRTNGVNGYGTTANGTGNYRSLANNADDDFDWGWLGLLGLAGLIGMRGRDRERT